MLGHGLRGLRVLVAEDEYLLADDLRAELEQAGAVVLGPVARLQHALDIIAEEPDIDVAVLDVNLSGDKIFPVADRLIQLGVPVIFTTGYDQATIPPRYSHIDICEKPFSAGQVAQIIGRLVEDGRRGRGSPSAGSGADQARAI